ncbi:alpha/beta fold hydrolase [Pendulispora albinea]|uniref:Alpha/beta hydrolase n=1 Tax=Pendulispora albinea TaxID=2741071 RepID=A0ABZ2LVB4_9BACT
MDRREFMELAIGGLAAGALAACGARAARGPAAGGVTTNAAAFGAARRMVETRFGKIAYVERGEGSAALFIHGFPLNGFQWRGALDRLSMYRRCIAPDLMGMGYTEIPDGQSVAAGAQAEMLVAVLDALSISAVDLVANDSGGAVAQILVARHPARFRTLLLTNCDTENDSPPPALFPGIHQARAGRWVDEWLAPQLADKNFCRSEKGLGGGAYTDPARLTDEAIDYYFAPILSSPRRKAQGDAYCAALLPNPLAGIQPLLQRCEVPVRIVWGTGDLVFSAANPDYLARTFPKSRGVRRIPGAKLFFPEELPDIIAEDARRLWGAGEHGLAPR